MEDRDVAVGQSRDRGGRCDHLHLDASGARRRPGPTREGEDELTFIEEQPRQAITTGDHGSGWQPIDLLRPQDAVGGAIDAPAPPQPLRGETSVQILGIEGSARPVGTGHRIPVGPVLMPTAEPTGAVARRQGHRIIEKEDRGPAPGSGESYPPAPIFGQAGDPELSPMMTHHLTIVTDQTAPVAGEHAPFGHGMQVAKRVDPVATWHTPTRTRSRFSRRRALARRPPATGPAGPGD